MKTIKRRRMLPLVAMIALIATVEMGAAIFAAASTAGINPRADTWRAVRQGEAGVTTSASQGHDVLIQSEGQLWRSLRNGPLAGFAPWLLAAVLAVILAFFLIFGQDKLEEPRSGRMLDRFNLAERILHWTTAVFFILLAVTGLSMLFGRAALIPVIGQGVFAAYLQGAMYVHNVSGPLFLACLFIEFVVWVKDNIPSMMDLRWFRNLGGMTGGPRPHAGKVNGGEKAWFWLMVLAGIGVGITGVLLNFPIWGQTRLTMQIAHIVHTSVAILFVAASFGHIYVGTIGAEGTFEGMWRGRVDAAWARQHQDLWYEKMTGREAQR